MTLCIFVNKVLYILHGTLTETHLVTGHNMKLGESGVSSQAESESCLLADIGSSVGAES